MNKLDEMIDSAKRFNDSIREVNNHLKYLLKKRELYIKTVEGKIESEIKPLKEEISQLDAEIERVMKESDIDKITEGGYTASIKSKSVYKITDIEKFLEFAQKNPSVIKKDVINTRTISSMIKEGIVPQPDKEGIDCNDTYQKIVFRKK